MGKITEQHIENIKDQVIMAREAEIPTAECEEARMPFPRAEVAERKTEDKVDNTPEGARNDNWVDDSFWLNYGPEEEASKDDRNVPEGLQPPQVKKKRGPKGPHKKIKGKNHEMVTRNRKPWES